MKKRLNTNLIERFSRQIILKNIGILGQKKILTSKVLIGASRTCDSSLKEPINISGYSCFDFLYVFILRRFCFSLDKWSIKRMPSK